MAKRSPSMPPESIALYEALIATHPEIEQKGATMPYTSANGHMFSFLTKEGRLGLRLPTEQREAFLVDHDTTLCVHYNTVMKEYVLVPDELFGKPQELKPYLAASFDYVRSLKPKPTKRKKKQSS